MNQDIINLQTFIGELDAFQNIQVGQGFTMQQKQDLALDLLQHAHNIRNHYAGLCMLYDDLLDRMGLLQEWLQVNPPAALQPQNQGPPSPPPSPLSHSAPAAGGKRKQKGGMNTPPRVVLTNITAKTQTPKSKNKKNVNTTPELLSSTLMAPPRRFRLTNTTTTSQFQAPTFTQNYVKNLQEKPSFEGMGIEVSNNNSNTESVKTNTSTEALRKNIAKLIPRKYANVMKNSYFFYNPSYLEQTKDQLDAMYSRQNQGLRALNSNSNGNNNTNKNKTTTSKKRSEGGKRKTRKINKRKSRKH